MAKNALCNNKKNWFLIVKKINMMLKNTQCPFECRRHARYTRRRRGCRTKMKKNKLKRGAIDVHKIQPDRVSKYNTNKYHTSEKNIMGRPHVEVYTCREVVEGVILQQKEKG